MQWTSAKIAGTIVCFCTCYYEWHMTTAMQMYHDYDNYSMHDKLNLLVDFNSEKQYIKCQHDNYIHMIDYPINAHYK